MSPPLHPDEFQTLLPQLLESFKASINFGTIATSAKKSSYEAALECLLNRTLMTEEQRNGTGASTALATAIKLEEATARGYFSRLRDAIDRYHKGEGKEQPIKFEAKARDYIFAQVVPEAQWVDDGAPTYDSIAGNPIDSGDFLRLFTALTEQQQIDRVEGARLFEGWVNSFENRTSPLWGLANRVMSEAKQAEERAINDLKVIESQLNYCVQIEEMHLRIHSKARKRETRKELEQARQETEQARRNLERAQRAVEKTRGARGIEAFVWNLKERQGKEKGVGLTIGDLGELAKLFRINPLLLLPLCSKPISDNHLELDFSSFIKGSPTKTGAGMGTNTEYRTPPCHLADTDAAFVLLRLGANKGSTESHEHPGDELVYVLSGRVEFVFEHNGIVTSLNAGDLIHFYAEHKHFARIPEGGDASELLIVRFYQLEKRATRQALALELETDLGSRRQVSEDAGLWIRQLAPPTKVGIASYDNLGLSRFLSDWAARRLEAVPRDSSEDPDSFLGRAFTAADLDRIASARDIEPYLLYHYAMSAQPSPVIIRKLDYKRFPPQGSSRAEYRIPKRNLSCSDISIAKVILEGIGSSGESGVAPASTTFNRHPGYEVIFVTQGAVRLYYEGVDEAIATAAAAYNQLCHFDSSISHRICNDSLEKNAEYFVIRFYRDGRYPKA